MSKVNSNFTPPGYVSLYLSMRPTSQAAIRQLMLPRMLEFKLDMFARRSVREQFYERYCEVIDDLRSFAPRWSAFLIDNFRQFEQMLQEDSNFFQSPFRSVKKSEFQKVKLSEILKLNPNSVEIYIADDWNSDGKSVSILRAHSTLLESSPSQRYLWFEKAVPWVLFDEDVIPWFRSLIKRLPKKSQPENLPAWLQRLARNHPEFVSEFPEGRPWESKPRIALIFGTLDQVGLSSIYHIERSEITSLFRKDAEVQIRASVSKMFSNGIEAWLFRIFAHDSECAARLEAQILDGRFLHFGLGRDIAAILGTTESQVESIGLTDDQILHFCRKEGRILASYCARRLKHKTLHYYGVDERREGFSYVLE